MHPQAKDVTTNVRVAAYYPNSRPMLRNGTLINSMTPSPQPRNQRPSLLIKTASTTNCRTEARNVPVPLIPAYQARPITAAPTRASPMHCLHHTPTPFTRSNVEAAIRLKRASSSQVITVHVNDVGHSTLALKSVVYVSGSPQDRSTRSSQPRVATCMPTKAH